MVCISTVSDIPCVLLFTQNLHQTEYPNMGDSHSRFPSLLFPHKYDLFPNQKCGTISHLFTLGYLFTIYKPVFKYVAIAVGCGIGFNMMMPLPPCLLKLFNAIIGIGAFYILSVTTMRIEKTLIYQSIAPNSFGIYLFHPMVIYWLEFIATPYEINPILLSLCVFIISLTLSIFLTIAVRNIGLGILIGENQNNQIEDSCQIPFPRTSE